ncbi:MAG: hypothetical protein WKF58_17715 [Ilumatobacteraceae bacterium]
MTDGSEMETLSAAIARLQAVGYTGNWYAGDDGDLVCEACGAHFERDRHARRRDRAVRGDVRSRRRVDPRTRCSTDDGHKGLYSTTFGPEMAAGDVAVIHAIRANQR